MPGNPWLICTLWQAQYIIAKAQKFTELAPAMKLLEWCVARAEKSGVLAEQYHPHTGDPMSVSPLTWSHATFVIAVVEYLAKLQQITAGLTLRTGDFGEPDDERRGEVA